MSGYEGKSEGGQAVKIYRDEDEESVSRDRSGLADSVVLAGRRAVAIHAHGLLRDAEALMRSAGAKAIVTERARNLMAQLITDHGYDEVERRLGEELAWATSAYRMGLFGSWNAEGFAERFGACS